MSDLNTMSYVPLYQQLKKSIMELINNGSIKVNEQIPSEIALMETFKVSRVTVRAAINELVEEEVLIKKQGKGTYVRPNRMENYLVGMTGFYESCRLNNVKPSTKVLKSEMAEMPEKICQALNTPLGTMAVYCSFLRYADGIPIKLDSLWFMPEYSYLLDMDLTQEIYPYICKKEHITLINGGGFIEICRATSLEADILQIKRGDPLILMEKKVMDSRQKPVHYDKVLIVGESYRFYYS